MGSKGSKLVEIAKGSGKCLLACSAAATIVGVEFGDNIERSVKNGAEKVAYYSTGGVLFAAVGFAIGYYLNSYHPIF
jgi:hypothetical protein